MNCEIGHFNLDVIISAGYRGNSVCATQFRRIDYDSRINCQCFYG
ncbi:virulence RhuM family protein [Enterocloster clostridioformis]|uniref:Virulence RhuM family protein n=1 Tax=Hungatella hominis TaxID=2763050 RepID=A0ABR7H441_9FIRM|nr:virulence RhuM family protein [Hungatella hominis]MCF2705203.1 virulence RhuM family protein [Enterocloster clostridioformis]NSJ57314.1 virulence RhuM family protein [Enterocloster clostridioformis]